MSEKKWWSWKREEEEDAEEGSLKWSERSERSGSEPSPATPIAAGGGPPTRRQPSRQAFRPRCRSCPTWMRPNRTVRRRRRPRWRPKMP
jgi:hypothetical protein